MPSYFAEKAMTQDMFSTFPTSQQRKEKPVPLLVLDLDGTVREGKDDALGKFVNGSEDVRACFPKQSR